MLGMTLTACTAGRQESCVHIPSAHSQAVPSLVELDLGHNRLNDVGVIQVNKETLHCPALCTFSRAESPLTGAGTHTHGLQPCTADCYPRSWRTCHGCRP
jgi:hypothetical protein